jgi:hypothetical protein
MDDGRGLVALSLLALLGAAAARGATATRGSSYRSLAGLRRNSTLTVVSSPFEEERPLPWSFRAPAFLEWVSSTLLDDKYGGFDSQEPISQNLDTAIEIAEANGYKVVVGAAP